MSSRCAHRPALVVLMAVALGAAAVAGDAVNTDKHGLALQGYDPVAYFTEAKPTKGDPAITAEHLGATYRFASAANREAFLAEPDRYAPQYGGWCAYAMARGSKADIDPGAFKVVDGKLYLNYSAGVQKKWEQDIPGYIAKADDRWPEVRDR